MSRFFAASDSSSDEESEEELYSNDGSEKEDTDKDSDDDDSDDDDDSSDDGEGGGASKFLKDAVSDSESEDEDQNKVLKSAKDKRFDELEATVRLIENAQKINDWAVISERACSITPGQPCAVLTHDRVRQAQPPGAVAAQAE
jgi:translation initiation factor 3 subunit C